MPPRLPAGSNPPDHSNPHESLMARRRKNPPDIIERTAEGYVVNLDEEEIALLVRLLAELRALLLADDPSTAHLVRRLFPPAYLADEHAEAEADYQRFMREELVASRLTAIGAVEEALTSARPMSEGELMGFMQALNGVRLVLGTLLDVSEEHDPNRIRDDDPMVGEHHLYQFLSWLMEHVVAAASS